jgi:hypothetical protein
MDRDIQDLKGSILYQKHIADLTCPVCTSGLRLLGPYNERTIRYPIFCESCDATVGSLWHHCGEWKVKF